MNDQTVRILCLAIAEYARIEGMKVANSIRSMNDEAPAYNETDFLYVTSTLEQLSHEVK